MPLSRHARDQPGGLHAEPDPAAPIAAPPGLTLVPPVQETRAVPATRTSVAWLGVWSAAIVLVVFSVFILLNTRGVRVSFLWLHGTLPLAVGLLIATVAGIVVTLVLGTARITQLRRPARWRRG